jgi:3-methylcrotonyl-CoA carboxylase alpha subunit
MKLFIANRGEIACRIALTAHRMGIPTCGVFTPQDSRTRHVRIVQELAQLPPGDLSQNYLNQDLLLQIAKAFQADALHPGYGFLSENPDFAEKVIDQGFLWIGPTPDAMRSLGGKVEAKKIAEKVNVPVVPWRSIQDDPNADQVIREFGLPLLMKAAHGGGGRGQRIVRERSQFDEALRAAGSESLRSFGSSEVFIERFLEEPRHIEVQILADHHQNVFVLGERDCTLQRRNQKVVEETPAAILDEVTRKQIHEAAKALAVEVGYTNAGTIEFLAQKSDEKWEFYFMELNARLQVEHPVSEMVTGLDLVELQIRAARGENLAEELRHVTFDGHAIELRICAEDPANNLLPTPGPVNRMNFPDSEQIRVDSGYDPGDVIPQEYDSLIAKLIVHGKSRDVVIKQLSDVLANTMIAGTITNKFFLERVLKHPDFRKNRIHTRWIESHPKLLNENSEALDQELISWGKKFYSDLLVQRTDRATSNRLNAETLTAFFPDWTIHGSPSPKGVTIGGEFDVKDQEHIHAEGWVSRFELCITFQRPICDVVQRKITFAGRYEIADLRTHHGPITAQVPGVVLQVRARPNDIVEALQPILIVEAMKIEMPFVLPIAARITEIHVGPGDRILPGQQLVTWEPAS